MPILETALLVKGAMMVLAAVGAAAVVVKILEYLRVLEWFRSRRALKMADRENIALTIKTAKANGRVGVVQGIFNETHEKFLDAVEYDAENLDHDLRIHHRDKDVVIYN